MQNARRKWAAENFFIARRIGNGGEREQQQAHHSFGSTHHLRARLPQTLLGDIYVFFEKKGADLLGMSGSNDLKLANHFYLVMTVYSWAIYKRE